jgi:hypothetical protein
MKYQITTNSPTREYYVLQINGRVNSMHRYYQDALRAGLLLKYEFPNDDVKLCETHCEGVGHDTGLH